MAEYLENIWQTDLTPGQHGGTRSTYPTSKQLVLPVRYLQHGVFTSWDESTDGITWMAGSQRIVVSPPGGYLTLRDALLLGTLGQRFLGRADWDDRVITLSLNECVRAMGYTTSGGKQRRQAASAIQRLTVATLTWQRTDIDSTGKPVTTERFAWHILDANATRVSATGGGVAVRLSEETAGLLCDGMLKSLTTRIARNLVNADEVAARLWLFLESERMPDGQFTYHVLRPSEPVPGRSYIADVVGISHWQNKRNIKTRIAQAIGVIEEHEEGGRYVLRLRTNKSCVTFLEARRTSRRELKRRESGPDRV